MVGSVKRLLLWFGVGLLVGCSDKTLVVQSNTVWSGTVDQFGAISGRGNGSFDLGSTYGQVCWTITKETVVGILRAYSDDKTWFGLGSEVDGDQTTTEPNGKVTGCSQ